MSEEVKDLFNILKEAKLNIRSMNTVYSTEMIHQRFQDCEEEGSFVIPDFQRSQNVWDKATKSRFIESLFLDMPIMNITVFAFDIEKLEIVDGLQRINTIHEYINNDLKLNGLELLEDFNGKSFHDLPSSLQIIFKRKALNFTILDDTNDESIKYELFNRINRGQSPLLNQEKREIKRGKFTDLVNNLSTRYAGLFRAVNKNTRLKFSSIRKYDHELIARVLYLFQHHEIKGNFKMEEVLDKEYKNQDKHPPKHYQDLESFFSRSAEYILSLNIDEPFTKAHNFSSIRFDAIMTGLMLAIKEDSFLKDNLKILKDLIELCKDKEKEKKLGFEPIQESIQDLKQQIFNDLDSNLAIQKLAKLFKDKTPSDGSNAARKINERINFVKELVSG
jgi:hypothetical protein